MKTFLKALAIAILLAVLIAAAATAEGYKRRMYAKEVANELERREQAKGNK